MNSHGQLLKKVYVKIKTHLEQWVGWCCASDAVLSSGSAAQHPCSWPAPGRGGGCVGVEEAWLPARPSSGVKVGRLAGWLAGFYSGCLTSGTEHSAARPSLPCCLLRTCSNPCRALTEATSIWSCFLVYMVCTGGLSTFQGQEFPLLL